ncbi:MAG: hypothetical protein CBC42_07925 [Betaproteobacteria bacterium TMED82]|nr:MAG: hypothetical protein CBC42_07925 [Betaproteobacteria bacterium TMED82]|tara:strand:+ start:147 stop:410 length:264 start_codon:yes stop_codon:yes gene_type:complete
MAIKNSFYDSVGGIASGEGLVHLDMMQRSDFSGKTEDAKFEVSERITMSITTFLKLHKSINEVVTQLEDKGVIRKAKGKGGKKELAN